jgi:4-hydroxy-3-polyprenylbenzoate decarboxylase
MSAQKPASTDTQNRFIIGITGASGADYALRLIWRLSAIQGESDVIISPNFYKVLASEGGLQGASGQNLLEIAMARYGQTSDLHEFSSFPYTDIGARAASGSQKYRAMVIVPCSMKTLAAVTHGLSQNLIERAADVSLKERRTLIVCPRESPLSTIHLRNMLALSEAGAVVMPLMPGYYHNPQNITDLYDFMIDRIMQHLGLSERAIEPWQG